MDEASSGKGYACAASQTWIWAEFLSENGYARIASHATAKESSRLPVDTERGTASAKSQTIGRAFRPKVVHTVSWSPWLSQRQSEEFRAAARLKHRAIDSREVAIECGTWLKEVTS